MIEPERDLGIRSMTGFGRSSFEVGGIAFDVEVRTVNHRHLDLRLKLPRQLNGHESAIRTKVPKRLGRGKVDVVINLASGAVDSARLEIDHGVAKQYVDAARDLATHFEVAGALDVTSLMTMTGVTQFVDAGLPEVELERELEAAVDRALLAVDEARLTEGAAIGVEFRTRLAAISTLVDSIDGRSDLVVEGAKERLRKRTSQLELESGVVDEGRLHQEIVIAADRLDISEELARLRSHIEQFLTVLASAGPENPVGRRLDFLLQELGREANTVGSKANDALLAHDVVEVKTELERIREQVQNIE
jgi:uncharacterized protein (TIGR00255 family)